MNFIETENLNSRTFKELCKETGVRYKGLLCHSEARWFSRGRVVSGVVELVVVAIALPLPRDGITARTVIQVHAINLIEIRLRESRTSQSYLVFPC